MGGTSYDRDVQSSSSSSGFSSGGFASGADSSAVAKEVLSRKRVDQSVLPRRRISTQCQAPIVILLDVTGSNIEFARVFYDKMPMCFGQIEQQGYLSDFDICFAATGDANSDEAPLQVCDFAAGLALDDWLAKLWLEGGGGGQRMETYELAAWYFSHYCDMPSAEQPFFFIIADEAPYPDVKADQIRSIIGNETSDMDSKQVFEELFKKFQGNVFILLNPYFGDTERWENEQIMKKWKEILGPRAEHIIRLYEEKSIIDVILGVIALRSGARDLTQYLEDMKSRGQTKTRIEHVKTSLRTSIVAVPVVKVTLSTTTDRKRTSGGRRI